MHHEFNCFNPYSTVYKWIDYSICSQLCREGVYSCIPRFLLSYCFFNFLSMCIMNLFVLIHIYCYKCVICLICTLGIGSFWKKLLNNIHFFFCPLDSQWTMTLFPMIFLAKMIYILLSTINKDIWWIVMQLFFA